MCSSPNRVKPKNIKLVFVASPLNTPHYFKERENKDWLALNQDNVSEWSEMSIRGV
jgi:hypothetical protein